MFITLEGIEGSGKTTQLPKIVDFLKNRGHECVVTREPGGTPAGAGIRSILLDPDNKGLDPVAELLLYSADRTQHIREIIQPALSAGKTVVCDRFYDATTAYQGFARGIDMGLIHRLHDLVLAGLKPRITLLFDLPSETGLSRAWQQIDNGSRTTLETRFEKEALAFHKKVREGYLELARKEPDRFRVIDAAKDEEQVTKEVLKTLADVLDSK